MNILDKTIAIFSPRRALQRATARKALDIMNLGYSRHGASTGKKPSRND